ncbi:MAG: hypothetical protein R3C52_05790 [Hyphomonadaceae bacterium]
MIRKLMLGASLAAGLVLSACASFGPTPYQSAAQSSAGGYSETRIEPDRYRISFKGNSMTDRETVENYMLFRAAELTLQLGYDNFTIVNRDTDAQTRVRTDPGYFGPHMSYMYFHPRYGWMGAYDPFWTRTTFDEITRYEAFAEVLMAKGPKGSDPDSFDAREVSKNLAPLITRPPQ